MIGRFLQQSSSGMLPASSSTCGGKMPRKTPHTEQTKQKIRQAFAAKQSGFPATKKPTVRDLEWAAGFLEGEGSFVAGIGRRNKTPILCLSAAQVNPDPLIRLMSVFGGRTVKRKLQKPNHQPCWVWYTYGARARGIALTLYTLLSDKRKAQIRAAI